MTMSSSVSKVTLNGNGSQTSWPFSFKVWKADDLEVSITSPAGATTVVANWSVVLAPVGGTVTYPTTGDPLPSGSKITIKRSMDFLQDVDLVSGTRWDPEVVETALDQATAERQQLREKLDRAVVVDVASTSTPEALLASVYDARDTAVANAAAAAASAEIAEAAAGSVGFLSASGTLDTGEDVIELPFVYNFELEAVAIYLAGVKQEKSTLTFIDNMHVQVGAPVSAPTVWEAVSVVQSGEGVLTAIRYECLDAQDAAEAAQAGAELAETNAELAQAGAELAQAGAEAAQAAAEAAVVDLAPATETQAGVVELATSEETSGLSDPGRAIVPANLPAGVKAALNTSGDAPMYVCRAWVNFDGSTTPPSIRGSGNVSSVVRNSTGVFTINFETPMPSAGFSVQSDCMRYSDLSYVDVCAIESHNIAAGFTKIRTSGSSTQFNPVVVCVSVFH